MNQDVVIRSEAMNLTPRISVIVATYNCEITLQRCIDSVAKQTFPKVELILIDGGSTDETVDVISANEGKLAYWESRPDRGIYHAWNKALKHARGEWIYFMGADDYFWSSTVLDKVDHFICKSKSFPHVIYGKVNVVDASDHVLGQYGEEWPVAKKHFFELMTIPHQGVFHHRSLFSTHGEFDEQYKIVADYEFLLRELIDGEAVFMPNLIVSGMQQGGVSSDPRFALRALKEIEAVSKKYAVGGLRIYWRLAYMRAWLRRLIKILFGEKLAIVITHYYRSMRARLDTFVGK